MGIEVRQGFILGSLFFINLHKIKVCKFLDLIHYADNTIMTPTGYEIALVLNGINDDIQHIHC